LSRVTGNHNLILMRKIYPFFLSIFCIYSFATCQKNTFRPFTSGSNAFKIFEVVADTSYQTDTALTLNDLLFIPNYEYDSVNWLIDNIAWHKNKPQLSIKFISSGTFPILMIGYGKNTAGQPVKDSIVQYVHIIDRELGAAYLGNFRGVVSDAETDSFNVKIMRVDKDYPAYPRNAHILSNLPKGCLSELPPDGVTPLTMLSFGYRLFVTDAARCFPGTKCVGRLQNGKLVVEFGMRDPSRPFDPVTGQYPMIVKKYVGSRF
jgi:hypothetical protein